MSKTSGVDQKELEKLIKNLKILPDRVQKNVVAGAIRAAAVIPQKIIKSGVPVDSGELKKAIRVRKVRRSPRGTMKFHIYVKEVELPNGKKTSSFFGRDTTKMKNTKQYMYYLEYGTKSIPARPNIRTALERSGNRPVEASRAYFKPRFEKEKKKLGFK